MLEVDYDKYNATHLAQTLDSDGFEMVIIPQSIKHLSEPTKSFRDHVYQKKIIHAGDGMLAWAIGNAVTKLDSEENMKLDKKKSKDRIDPIAAVIMDLLEQYVKKTVDQFTKNGSRDRSNT
ncbi:terminase TerL endonuclease subunit [Brevibacillus laterosporus]|uniref:terminase TerL endonuclease subunit n=1 Tax=Brevibacillus laterosporus TaxID=1465 RepID=UPI0023E2FADB|nr:terminase TerL endonuclease subunit [Brevibacillus laterosporus]